MRLFSLSLANFRCFESCELDLNVTGLVGITGTNGAGKSTLLESIDYAFYGIGRGQRMEPPTRDGARRSTCRVTVEFEHGDRHVIVARGPTYARLEVDGVPLVEDGQEDLTRAVTGLLGIGRQAFWTTFYARQHEIEALGSTQHDKRQAQLEALLGLTHLRTAAREAAAQARDKRAAIAALEGEAADVGLAEQNLARAEEEAKARAPAVEQAHDRRAEAQRSRSKTWKEFEQAQTRLQATLALERKAAVAAERSRTASAHADAVRTERDRARDAAAKLATLAEVAASATALVSAEREAERTRQLAETAKRLHARAADARAAADAAAQALAAAEDPTDALATAEGALAGARQALAEANDSLLSLTRDSQAAETAEATAVERHAALLRAEALDEELRVLRPAGEAAETDRTELARLQADHARIRSQLDEEERHRSDVERDGAHASCPRCLRKYGDDYESILAGFDTTLTDLRSRLSAAGEAIAACERRIKERAEAVKRLPVAEAERSAIRKPRQPLEDLATACAAATAERGRLAQELDATATRKTEAEATIKAESARAESLRKQARRREKLASDASAQSEAADSLASEAESTPVPDYDPAAHAELRTRRDEAIAAQGRVQELETTAARLPQLELDLTTATDSAQVAAREAEALRAEAAERAGDHEACTTLQHAYESADRELQEAAEALALAEEAAVRDDAAVASAKTALRDARAQARRLKAERREGRYRDVVADLLDGYRSQSQAAAVPGLAEETAALLQRVTRGRYSDVEVDAEGRLTMAQHGEQRPLRRFSGGEQDLANLCLRIALAQRVARRSGMEAGFIILDEVLASQHRDRRQLLIDALKELEGEFQQVFIITHFDDFLDHCSLQVAVDGDGDLPSTAIALAA